MSFIMLSRNPALDQAEGGFDRVVTDWVIGRSSASAGQRVLKACLAFTLGHWLKRKRS